VKHPTSPFLFGGDVLPLDDEVILRYNFHGTRLLRKAVRYVANEHSVSETEIVKQALVHYRPILETMEKIRKGEKNGIG
jgi:hypothetical protein